jgi:hypothetical protein
MIMLFDRKEFEHKIEESKLKKGLQLFLKQKVEFTHKTENFGFTFLIHSKISQEIFIHLKGDKIIDYTCSCGNENYCEHLAAVIFYLEQENLGVLKLPTSKYKSIKQSKSRRSKKSIFEKYIHQIKLIIDPIFGNTKPTTEQIAGVTQKINFEKNGAATFNNDFYFDLSVICELTKLIHFNFAKTEGVFDLLIENSKKGIEANFRKGLTAIESCAFIDSAYYSLRSQGNFRSGIYSFLISRASVLIKDVSDFDNLRDLLKKRNQNKNSLDPINRKLVAEIQLMVMEATLLNKTYSLKNYENTIEVPIALSELEFHKRKKAKGFKFLEEFAGKIKKFNINKYLDLIDEALKFSKYYENKNAELFYLEEKFIYGYFISDNDLARYFSINKGKTEDFIATELIKKLKSESTFYTFEKISAVLLRQNKLDELIAEIKKEKNKFKLLNDIGIKKLPEYSSDFFAVYIKHLINAIAEAKFPYFQQQLFDLAKVYLDLLPDVARASIIEKIKEKMIYEKHMVQYISKVYSVKV